MDIVQSIVDLLGGKKGPSQGGFPFFLTAINLVYCLFSDFRQSTGLKSTPPGSAAW